MSVEEHGRWVARYRRRLQWEAVASAAILLAVGAAIGFTVALAFSR